MIAVRWDYRYADFKTHACLRGLINMYQQRSQSLSASTKKLQQVCNALVLLCVYSSANVV